MVQPTRSAPSSGIAGFFQDQPLVHNAFEEDDGLRRAFTFYLPSSVQDTVRSDLLRFGGFVHSKHVLSLCAEAEKNVPYLRTFDSWGRRVDELVTSAGWRSLQNLGIAEGIVAIGHETKQRQYSRPYQFLKYHLWTPFCVCVTCPSAMTDGAARLLHNYLQRGEGDSLEREVFQRAYEHLVSRDPESAWTSGQWMTERTGGSDVQNTETIATHQPDQKANSSSLDADGKPLGPYSVSGFKWFSSATDAQMTVLLAQEPGKGISAFYAPLYRKTNDPRAVALNGVSIQRLKSKLGTRALPTAELILSDMRAWRIGKSGQGTKEISTVLNITRVHNAVTALGLWGRGLAISRAFSRVRKARGQLLCDTPAHVATLAEQHVQYRGLMHLAYFTASMLGVCENIGNAAPDKSPCAAALDIDDASAPHILRLLTPLSKALTARAGIAGLAECMESLGGVGYLENEDISLNIARLFRDVNVLSIWEGTTNIMADDVIRIVKGSSGVSVLDAVDKLVSRAVSQWKKSGKAEWADAVSSKWAAVRKTVEGTDKAGLAVQGRQLSRDFGYVLCSVLLGLDALRDGSDIEAEIATRWITSTDQVKRNSAGNWKAQAEWDRKIVFGSQSTRDERSRL